MSNEKLVGTTRQGDFVHASQDMAKEQGFQNVSKKWYDKTISIDEGIEQIEDQKRKREDIVCPIRHMQIIVNDNNQIVVEDIEGREFLPTNHAMKQMANWCDRVSHGIVKRLTTPHVKPNGEIAYNRDRQDAETLAMLFNNGKRRIDPNKEFRFRTYDDGTLRAMMSTIYAPVDNVWYLNCLKDFMPDARLSHWKGDADTIFGNILIPDTIRQEDDGDYGGMMSLSNCEIGTRRIDAIPSIFRAICMNGCIWDEVKGNGLSKVHRGEIDLKELEKDIVETLHSQIPILDEVVNKFLATREMKIEKGDNVPAILATIAKDYKLTSGSAKSQLVSVLTEYHNHESENRSLFGIVNAVTRAGQRDNFTPAQWVEFDHIGGKLACMDENQWEKLRRRSNAMDAKTVDNMFGIAS